MTTRIRPGRHTGRWLIALVSMAIVPAAAEHPASPNPTLSSLQPCPPNEEIFLSRGYKPSGPYGHRLVVSNGTHYGSDGTMDEPWLIQTFDRETGKITSELLLKRTFPNGRTNWNVGPRHESKIAAVDEIDMNASFKPARESTYALIIPGFADWTPALLRRLLKNGDLKFLTRPGIVPDLSEQLVWVVSCLGRR